MSINVLLTLVEQYKEAAQLIEAAQAEQEQLKIQIREALAERSTNYLEVGCHKVRLSDFSSTRLDSKAIKAVQQNSHRHPPEHHLTSPEKSPIQRPPTKVCAVQSPQPPAGAGYTNIIPVPAFFIKRKVRKIMKQTVKTSRAAGQLEKMFRELNKHYFAGKLPEPIISLKKTPSAYGHITCS